jgi:hypothetical protein
LSRAAVAEQFELSPGHRLLPHLEAHVRLHFCDLARPLLDGQLVISRVDPQDFFRFLEDAAGNEMLARVDYLTVHARRELNRFSRNHATHQTAQYDLFGARARGRHFHKRRLRIGRAPLGLRRIRHPPIGHPAGPGQNAAYYGQFKQPNQPNQRPGMRFRGRLGHTRRTVARGVLFCAHDCSLSAIHVPPSAMHNSTRRPSRANSACT